MSVALTLRDGTQTRDPRLTRLVQFDARSLSYPVGEAIATSTPRSYTWRCTKHLDQGVDGACVGFSMTHELIARPAEVVDPSIDAKFAKERVYWEAQKIDEWPGGSYPGNTSFYEGTSVLAGIKVIKQLGYVDSYRWAFSIDELALAVGHVGPAVLGIPWYESMFEPHACGQIHVYGDVVGGHAILCKGVNVKERTFTLHNSWGSSWADGGDVKVSWDDLDRLLHESGEAVIPMGRRRIPSGV